VCSSDLSIEAGFHRLAALVCSATDILLVPAGNALALAKLYVVLLRMFSVHRKVISDARAHWEKCDLTRSGECNESMYSMASRVRSMLMSLHGQLQREPRLFSHFIRKIDDSIADWDDLAEDCHASSDKDIRDSIHRIASLC